jgi:hypothetical protein
MEACFLLIQSPLLMLVTSLFMQKGNRCRANRRKRAKRAKQAKLADQSKEVTSCGEGDWESDAEEDEDPYRLADSLLSTLISFLNLALWSTAFAVTASESYSVTCGKEEESAIF